jgi:hypothetical protein
MKKKFKKTNIEWDIKDMERREYNKNVMSWRHCCSIIKKGGTEGITLFLFF